MAGLVIIGNGITGITTARHVRKRSDMAITVVSSETDYFFSRTALMYIYMGHMRFKDTKPYEDNFWEKNRINLIRAFVTKIDTAARRLQLEDGRMLEYEKLVIATGSKSNKFGWPGEDLPGVQGLYSYPDLEMMESNTAGISNAVIVGGGLIGIEVAEMLLSRGIGVTFLIRETCYWNNILPNEEAILVGRHIEEHGIELKRNTNLKEILAGPDGRACAIVTEAGEEIACQFVALTPGVSPNISVVEDFDVTTGRGVLVNDYLETNIDNVYAAGDCAEIVVQGDERNRIEQLWYTGRMQGLALAKTICGERTRYERGIWFNSAKFMDIEYQTYGFVSNTARPGNHLSTGEHPDHRQCVRIVYTTDTGEIIGCNFFGIRQRQEVWQRWIAERRDIDYVMQNLREANFDPGFFIQYEDDIIAEYNQKSGKQIRVNGKSSIWSRLFA